MLANIITILIALSAALIALYQVKMNIISQSRIIWIENLRNNISSYCVEVSNCATLFMNMIDESSKVENEQDVNEEVKKHYPTYLESSNKTDRLGYQIKLYLNSKEKEHKEIEDLIDKITVTLNKELSPKIDIKILKQDLNEIIRISKTIFKIEWEKSKKWNKI